MPGDPARRIHEPDEIRPIVALFADIVGSTSLGERLAPGEVKVVIGECIGVMTAAVEEYGGCVCAYVGDGIAAFFGVDDVHEDDHLRAALAALSVAEAVDAYAFDLRRAWGIEDFGVRIGINAGKAGVGLLGWARPHRTALGDCVNVAARLQAMAPPGAIYIGEALQRRLPPNCGVSYVGRLSLRGRGEAVRTWRLTSCAFEQVAAHEVRPLIGRSSEMTSAAEMFERVCRGRGGIVFIEGEAGIGKTRLLQALRDKYGTRTELIEGSNGFPGRARPLQMLRTAVRSWLHVENATPEVAARLRVKAKLAGLHQSDMTVGFIERLLGFPSPEAESSLQGAHEDITEGIRAALAETIKGLARERPVVIALEDVDRGDVQSCQVVTDVFALVDHVPVLFVLTARGAAGSVAESLFTGAHTRFPHRLRVMQVAPLDDHASMRLVDQLDSSGNLSLVARKRIANRAEGNPLFVEELVLAAVNSDKGSEFEHEVPVGIEALLLARIHVLHQNARRLLEIGAVVGRTFPLQLVQLMTPDDATTVLQPALRGGLIVEGSGYPAREYSFRHALIRDVILASLPRSRKRHLHALAARALETVMDEPGDRIAEIAYHYAESDDVAAGLRHLENLARRLQEQSDLEGCAEAWTRALALARLRGMSRSERVFQIETAKALSLAGYHDAAAELCAEIAERSSGRERNHWLLWAARSEICAGHVERAISRVSAVAGEIAPEDDEMAPMRYVEALIALRRNDYVALELALKQLESMELSPDVSLEVVRLRAGYYLDTGDFESARNCLWQREELARALGRSAQIVDSVRDRGVFEIVAGHVGDACRTLSAAVMEARSIRSVGKIADAGSNLLYALYLRGSIREGLAAASKIEGIEALPVWAATFLTNLGSLEFEAGAFEAAEMHLTQGLTVAAREGYVRDKIAAVCSLALLDAHTGNVDRAEALARAGLNAAEGVAGRYEARIYARRILARIACIRTELSLAEEHLTLALEASKCAERPAGVATLRMLGEVREAASRGSGVRKLRESLSLAREMGMLLEEARAMRALAEAGYGDVEALRRDARALLERCGARRDLETFGEESLHGTSSGYALGYC